MKNKIKVGSILVYKCASKVEKKVLGVCGLAYFLSRDNEFTEGGEPAYTIGELEKKFTLKEEEWMPAVGQMVYIADPTNERFYNDVYSWEDDDIDKIRLERGLVFKTKEEAIKRAKEMLSK